MGRGRRAVIVGGGITGVLTARELLLSGFDVTIVEAAHIGAGSSSRTAAGIRQQFSMPDTVKAMRYAVAQYLAFAEETEDHARAIQQNGYLFLHATPEAWSAARARAEIQKNAGLLEVECLEQPELSRRFPWVNPRFCIGGTFCPTDGFLFPAVIYGEGSRRIRELGGEIVQGARVVGARNRGNRIESVETTRGTFEGDVFFDCTNAWSRRTARILGAEELPVEPLKRYLWFLSRAGNLDAKTFSAMPLVVSPTGVYGRPENPDTWLMGFAHETHSEPDFTYDDQDRIEPSFSHNAGLESTAVQAWLALSEAIPAIGEFAGISATSSGYYGSTPDHTPFFGFDRQLVNLVRLVGFSGHGAMLGPFTARVGRALAEAGHDVDSVGVDGDTVSLAAFRIGRPLGHSETMVI